MYKQRLLEVNHKPEDNHKLSGHQLLFTLSQKLAIPSLCTLHSQSAFTIITPTIGTICNEHFNNNIRATILSGCTDSVLCGVSLMIDEITLEEMAIHFSKYNKVGGLCWKHSHIIDPILQTYESAVHIAQKIHDGHVHLGKELAVVGASCFRWDEIFPILAAPTCKTENTNDMEQILARAITRWNLTGTTMQIRPVWSVATDGNATRHAAGHRLFVKSLLSESSELYGTLINMPGLNLMTAITKLLYPDNPQDVPRAVELMLAIIEFSNSQCSIINDSFAPDIDTHMDLQSIALLSALLESILLPFTDVSLSLFKQFNSVFCLTKQQALDPHAPFFLGDVGDDPLEILFRHTHMIGGHNSASSYAQALDHLGATKDIDELDPGHQHLKLTHQEGIDHINCEVWKGNIISAWRNGPTSQLDSVHYSFADHFSMPGIDMLCPFGDNKYLWISLDKLQDASDVPKLPPPRLEGEEEEDEELMLNFQEALIDESTDAAPSTQPSSSFSADPLSPPLPQGPGIRPDDYLLYNGHWIHKQTIC
ncbi:hypothetical protein BD769DRAFT_1629965 [Suillus cothurnatus]|nr:hypothetical protein BD769DRAFT_1629965 [Suillus cothurnatus]